MEPDRDHRRSRLLTVVGTLLVLAAAVLLPRLPAWFSGEVPPAAAVTSDRDPVVDPAAEDFLNTLESGNCWLQALPPPLRLRLRGGFALDLTAEYTACWRPPSSLAVHGQVSLLRAAQRLEEMGMVDCVDDVELLKESLARQAPVFLDDLKRTVATVIGFSAFQGPPGTTVGPLAEWYAQDPRGLLRSGLVDAVVEPDPTGTSLVVRGLPGGDLAGQLARIHVPDGAACPDSMVFVGPADSLASHVSWQERSGVFLPVRLTMRSTLLAGSITADLSYRLAGDHWIVSRWTLSVPGLAEPVVTEVLDVEVDPDFAPDDWDDRLELTDEAALAGRFDDQWSTTEIRVHDRGRDGPSARTPPGLVDLEDPASVDLLLDLPWAAAEVTEDTLSMQAVFCKCRRRVDRGIIVRNRHLTFGDRVLSIPVNQVNARSISNHVRGRYVPIEVTEHLVPSGELRGIDPAVLQPGQPGFDPDLHARVERAVLGSADLQVLQRIYGMDAEDLASVAITCRADTIGVAKTHGMSLPRARLALARAMAKRGRRVASRAQTRLEVGGYQPTAFFIYPVRYLPSTRQLVIGVGTFPLAHPLLGMP